MHTVRFSLSVHKLKLRALAASSAPVTDLKIFKMQIKMRDVEYAPKIVDFLIIANAHNGYYKNTVIAQLPYA